MQRQLIVMILVALCLLGAKSPEVLEGRVVKIADGDTLTLLVGTTQTRVRLAQIDAPESKQPYGKKSKKGLGELLKAAKVVQVRVVDRDRYGRVVGTVMVAGKDINRELVRLGYAWVYREYLRDQSLLEVEKEAREQGRGLWSMPKNERIPPWEWRRAKRKDKGTKGAKSDPAPACGQKRTCSEMSSCDEAKFYLNTCGLKRLDGNGDGVPCEALCRK